MMDIQNPQQDEYQDSYVPNPQQTYGGGHTSEGALQFQLDSLEESKYLLRAINGEEEVLTPDGRNVIWKQTQEPMVNRKGLSIIKAHIASYLNNAKTYALSNLDKDYIAREVIECGEILIHDLEINWVKYDVKDESSASFIVQGVQSVVNAVLSKGRDATYLKFLRTTQQIQEVQHHQALSQQFVPKKDDSNILNAIFKRRK